MMQRRVVRTGSFSLGRSVAFAAIAATSVSAFPGGASAAGKLEELRSQGYARIAIGNEPPYSSVSGDGEIGGAAPDVAKAVLNKLGVPEVRAVIVDYGAMIPGLQAGRFDLVAAGLYIKPDRCKAILYSEPDVCDAEGFAVKAGNPKGITTYAGIASTGAKVATCGGCAEEKYALEAGVAQSNVVISPDPQSGLSMVRNDRVDVLALAGLVIADLVRKHGGEGVEMVYPVGDAPQSCAGAGFRKDDADFRDAYDKALQELKDSGEFKAIVENYGFSVVTALEKTRADFCPDN